jgi:hypothetical protein
MEEQDQERDHCGSAYLISPLTPARTEFSVRTPIIQGSAYPLRQCSNSRQPTAQCDTPYRVQALDTDLSPVYRARRDQSVAMVVLRIALWRLESGIGIRAGCDEGAKLKKVDEIFLH